MQEVQGTLHKMFAVAKLGFRDETSNNDTKYGTYTDHSWLSRLCFSFLETLTKSPVLSDHTLYIRRMDERTRRLLQDTILVSEVSVAYCHIVSAAHDLLKEGRYYRNQLQNLQYGSYLLASRVNS